MQTLEYRTVDKSEWGDGPWQSEPDKRQWQDETTGLPCLIVRGPSGALCGYVGVSKDHPAHGKDYWARRYDDDGNEVALSPAEQAIYDIEVHGGLTFADGCSHGTDESRGICHRPDAGEPDDVWWFGFDCAHSGDFSPRRERESMFNDGWYRDIEYVTAEVRSLAKQLAAAATPPAA